MEYLHASLHVLHGDLKADNLLLKSVRAASWRRRWAAVVAGRGGYR